ncbi:sigma-54-dependent Fis family transcriptional regulator [bacterium]|nr:sigma-54-dependent Fis family transcriptional regulator [bacterium]
MSEDLQRTPMRITLIDDEAGMRYIFTQHLLSGNHSISEFSCGEDFFAAIEKMPVESWPEVILLDLNIPDKMDGLAILKKVKQTIPHVEAIMLTAHGDTRNVVEAMRNGAFDYLLKPCSAEELVMTVERAIEHRNLVFEVQQLRSKLENRSNLEQIMGMSQEIKSVHANVERVANTLFSVLIQGESGTGKEVIARAIHEMSNRSSQPFIAVDCGAIPSTLIESELFGYEKGAFTGADKRKAGLFEASQDGTLFLDEIANIPIETQGKLLRALQEKKIMRVGGTQAIDINIRVICATNLLLEDAIKSGKFRLDLFYRLNEFTIYLPPLRNRKEDIIFLTNRFIREANSELNKQVGSIAKSAVEQLVHYHWPGNVRELKNVIRRAVLMADTEISGHHLIFDYQTAQRLSGGDGSAASLQSLKEIRKEAEKTAIQRALEICDGNKSEVSRMLDVDYKTLLTKIKEFNLE